uniref:Uncharacterized protein n=1 Tax=Neobodo designis TaxID=312471 RepID=A0A7S1MA05_NEODS
MPSAPPPVHELFAGVESSRDLGVTDTTSSPTSTGTSASLSHAPTPSTAQWEDTRMHGGKRREFSHLPPPPPIPRHREEVDDAVDAARWRPQQRPAAAAASPATSSSLPEEREAAVARLLDRYPELRRGAAVVEPTPSSNVPRYVADSATQYTLTPRGPFVESPPRRTEAAATFVLDPANSITPRDGGVAPFGGDVAPEHDYVRCRNCGVVAPRWHACTGSMTPAASIRSLRGDDATGSPRRSPRQRGTEGDEDFGRLRPRALPVDPSTHPPMPHALDARMLETWGTEHYPPAPYQQTPSAQPFAGYRRSPERGASPLRPGMQHAQRVLALLGARRTAPPRGEYRGAVASPRTNKVRSRDGTPPRPAAAAVPSRLQQRPRAVTPSASAAPRGAVQQSRARSREASPRRTTPAADAHPAARRCVWCKLPRPAEHDLRCAERRVVCRRCQMEVRAADQASHRDACRAGAFGSSQRR